MTKSSKAQEQVEYYRSQLQHLFVFVNRNRSGHNFVSMSAVIDELIKVRENEPK